MNDRSVYSTSSAVATADSKAKNKLLSIDFGEIASENELLDEDRFFRTYSNLWDVPDAIQSGRVSLVLGAKGTGKTAAVNYTKLLWKRNESSAHYRTTIVDFNELNKTTSPLESLTNKDVPGQVTSSLDATWKIFVGSRLLQSIDKDPQAAFNNGVRVGIFIDALKKHNLMVDDYPKLLRQVRTGKTTVTIPPVFAHESNSAPSKIDLTTLGDTIIQTCLSVETPNHHLIAIDGLDKSISRNQSYVKTIESLITFCDWFRVRSAEAHSPCHIVTLCRSDLFSSINLPDGNKILSDASVELDWYANDKNPDHVLLWDYLEKKTSTPHDELFALLPDRVSIGNKTIETKKWILGLTRYTPRDLVAFFTHVQKLLKHRPRIDSDLLRAAAGEYAKKYFLNEVRTESIGLLPNEVSAELPDILTELHKRIFNKQDLHEVLVELDLDQSIKPRELAKYLFKQGAIGNYDVTSNYVQFHHRNHAVPSSAKGPWMMHSALLYALDMPFS